MKNRVVTKTSVFPASKTEVYERIQRLSTLQHIAFPYATFRPLNGSDDLVWKPGHRFEFRFRLFGVIPFGVHTISVIEFDEDRGIYTEEGNRHVPVWNHRIFIEPLDGDSVRYTDEVEIGAGWKTPFVYLWAKMFYAHRQKRWIRLLKRKPQTEKNNGKHIG